MAVIGLLPASGRASRIAGIPKFCLPISDTKTLLHWHVERMLEVCDEIRVCTRSIWAPIVEMFDLPVKLYVRPPSTMSEAVQYLAGTSKDTFLVGMPDTIVLKGVNHYAALLTSACQRPTDAGLAVFDCRAELRGHVGQVLVRQNGTVAAAEDKNPACEFPHMWGAMLLRAEMVRQLDAKKAHPGLQLQQWIDKQHFVHAVRLPGNYVDIGRFAGLGRLYQQLINDN